jgi:hypothetical protein
VNDVTCSGRRYFGGLSDANARSTVDRPIPNSLATCRRGTPSATSRLINAQSSTEITHPICLSGLIFNRRYGLIFERRRQRVYPHHERLGFLSRGRDHWWEVPADGPTLSIAIEVIHDIREFGIPWLREQTKGDFAAPWLPRHAND